MRISTGSVTCSVILATEEVLVTSQSVMTRTFNASSSSALEERQVDDDVGAAVDQLLDERETDTVLAAGHEHALALEEGTVIVRGHHPALPALPLAKRAG